MKTKETPKPKGGLNASVPTLPPPVASIDQLKIRL